MDAELSENPDLAWELDDFNHRQRAMDFVRQFESTMCVYSSTVEQIYTSYNMFFPQDWDSKLVIIPIPQCFTIRFSTSRRTPLAPLVCTSFRVN
jgi:hypothetical protein